MEERALLLLWLSWLTGGVCVHSTCRVGVWFVLVHGHCRSLLSATGRWLAEQV
jgi:hypothetical protein